MFRRVWLGLLFWKLLFLLLLSPAWADPEWYYLRDDSTGLNIAVGIDDYEFQLSTYGALDRAEFEVFYGSLTENRGNDGNIIRDSYSAEILREETSVGTLHLTGKIGGEVLSIKTHPIRYQTGRDAAPSGTYRRVNYERYLAAARNRATLAEQTLNRLYNQNLNTLSPHAQAELRESQRRWLLHRDDAVQHPVHGGETFVDYWNVFTELTSERCEFLRNYTGKNVLAGRSGVYRDSYGGRLEIQTRGRTVAFALVTLRGSSAEVGIVGGRAELRGNRAVFRGTADFAGKKEPIELVLTFSDSHRIAVAATSGKLSAEAFPGIYYKSGPLNGPLAGPVNGALLE